MAKILLFLAAMCMVLMAQSNDLLPAGDLPFVSENDTLYTADTVLVSSVLNMTRTSGAVAFGFQFEAVGDSFDVINIYYKSRLAGLSWGVPFDSLGVDSMLVAIVDTGTVHQGRSFWINMADKEWWGYHDEGQIILQTSSDVDTIYVKCRVKGLRNE